MDQNTNNISWGLGTPSHHRVCRLLTGLQTPSILCLFHSSPRLQDLCFIWKKACCTSVQQPSNTASVHSSKSSPKFLNLLFSRFSQGCCHLCCLCTIPTTFFPWSQLSTNKLQHSTLQQPAFYSVPSCGLPSLWTMSMIIIWTTVKSAVGLCLHVLNQTER